MILCNFACARVSAEGPPEEQDEGLGLVDLVVDPSTRLLNSERSPLLFEQQAVTRHVSIDGLGQKHVTILILIVLVLFGVLNLVREVRHIALCSFSSLNY